MNEQLILNEKEIVSTGQPQYYQTIILAGCSFYLLWGYALSAQFDHYDPMLLRLIVCLPPMLSALLSFKLEWFTRHIKPIFYICLLIVITHYHFVMLKNNLSIQYILAALIFLFTIVNVVLDPKFKILFAVYFALLSSAIFYSVIRTSDLKTSENYILHLYGVTTVIVFTIINYFNYKKYHLHFCLRLMTISR